MSPYEGEDRHGKRIEGAAAIGFSPDSLDDAFRAAVDAAGQPHGTVFVVGPIKVLSVDDPRPGGYWVTITPDG